MNQDFSVVCLLFAIPLALACGLLWGYACGLEASERRRARLGREQSDDDERVRRFRGACEDAYQQHVHQANLAHEISKREEAEALQWTLEEHNKHAANAEKSPIVRCRENHPYGQTLADDGPDFGYREPKYADRASPPRYPHAFTHGNNWL